MRDTKHKASHHGYVPTDERSTSFVTLTMVVGLVIVVFVLFGIAIQKLWTNSGKLCVSECVMKYAQIDDFVFMLLAWVDGHASELTKC